MYTVYGIPNCNSVKKARTWLADHKISYQFHDYKKLGITKAKLTNWCKQVGWESLLNKNGTTWKGLDESVQRTITTQSAAINLMMEHTSVIKRPVIEQDELVVVVRFDENEYKKILMP